jgi:hypothetical protein
VAAGDVFGLHLTISLDHRNRRNLYHPQLDLLTQVAGWLGAFRAGAGAQDCSIYLTSRFRTDDHAMFTLVVFTMVIGSVLRPHSQCLQRYQPLRWWLSDSGKHRARQSIEPDGDPPCGGLEDDISSVSVSRPYCGGAGRTGLPRQLQVARHDDSFLRKFMALIVAEAGSAAEVCRRSKPTDLVDAIPLAPEQLFLWRCSDGLPLEGFTKTVFRPIHRTCGCCHRRRSDVTVIAILKDVSPEHSRDHRLQPIDDVFPSWGADTHQSNPGRRCAKRRQLPELTSR